jgi:hypothetical protein
VPRISAFHGIVIRMWFDDHPRPHFHARYSEYEVKMSINTLHVVRGRLPPRVLRRVREWAFAHRAELMDNWHRARAGKPLEPIDPLP